MARAGLALLLLIGLAGDLGASPARAQGPESGDEPAAAVKVEKKERDASKPARKGASRAASVSVMTLVRQANPMLWPLALCSVVALGYTLERLIALRRGRVVPRDFVERFEERLSAGKLDRDRAVELCKANDSPVARVFAHVVKYWGQPAAAIRQAVGHDAAVELSDLRRNVRVLNGTATLSPLLGLLGTVIGMIESFDSLGGSGTGAGKSEALAHGISLALMSTAFGLAIAVVSVAAYYYLLNRVDLLARDLDEQAGRVIDLVCAEVGRPLVDRRGVPGPTDYSRHEPLRSG